MNGEALTHSKEPEKLKIIGANSRRAVKGMNGNVTCRTRLLYEVAGPHFVMQYQKCTTRKDSKNDSHKQFLD